MKSLEVDLYILELTSTPGGRQPGHWWRESMSLWFCFYWGPGWGSGFMDSLFIDEFKNISGQVAKLVGTSAHIPKMCGFDPHSGHVQEATDQCFSQS